MPMFAALLIMVFIRFCFWACMVCVAVVLAFAGCIGVIARGVCEPFSPKRAQYFHDAASLLIRQAIRTAMFADNHRRWLLPNTRASRRY